VCVSNESKPYTAAAISSQTHSFKTNCFIVPCFCAKVGIICAAYLHSNKKYTKREPHPLVGVVLFVHFDV
jgi:hypothetical protein